MLVLSKYNLKLVDSGMLNYEVRFSESTEALIRLHNVPVARDLRLTAS